MALPNQNTTTATKPGKTITAAAVARGPDKKPGQRLPVDSELSGGKTRPATRKGKPTKWRKMADQAVKFVNLVAGLRRAVTLPVDAEHVAYMKNLSESLPTGELDDEVAVFVSSLHRLDAEQVPVPKVSPAPRFAVGDDVKIVKKFCLPRYTAFATARDLETMQVIEVAADGRQFLCTTLTNVQIHIAAPKHIEKQ